jgi:acyl-CoA synthetase (NDP forming)
MAHVLDALFHPAAAAVIGASTDPMKIGGRPVYFTLKRGFAGRLYPVNARASEVQGLPAYPDLASIGEAVDCAVISVPAPAVPDALEQCAENGVKVAAVFSAGFAEMGADGAAAQARLHDIARAGNVRILGPNCMGAFCVTSNWYGTFTTSFDHYGGKGWSKPGGISIASQSGAMGVQMQILLRDRGLGLSKWVTAGNQSDIDIPECIAYLAQDPETRTIVAYMEGCRDGGGLIEALEAARAAGKPVIMLKVGRSEVGAKAAASHTASLAGSDDVFDAVLRQCGVYRARNMPELVDAAAAVDPGRYPAGPDVGVLSTSGGAGVMSADDATALGLILPPTPDEAQARFRAAVPMSAPGNPIDTAAAGMTDMNAMTSFMEITLRDGGFSSIVMFLAHLGLAPERFDILLPRLIEFRKTYPDPIIAVVVLAPPEIRDALMAAGYLVYDDPSQAVRGIAALVQISSSRDRQPAEAGMSTGAGLPNDASEAEAKRTLSEAGISTVPERIAESAEQAAAFAEDLGLPVVLKTAAAGITHKTEIGGVVLGLETAAAVAEAYGDIVGRVSAQVTPDEAARVSVSPMVRGGVETIMGVQHDATFGPVVMFGIGGIFAEIYRDVAFRAVPFGREVAHEMIREIKGFPILDGARGRARADIDAIAEALVRLSAYAAHHGPAIDSIDINPFIALPQGQGAVAVDALIVRAPNT